MMRKLLLLVVALLTLGLMTTPVNALSLDNGDLLIHIEDATSLWTPDNGGLIPRLPNQVVYDPEVHDPDYAPDGAAVGDENRSVLNVSSIVDSGGVIALGAGQLTGLVYDLELASITPISADSVILTFTGGKARLYWDDTPEGGNQEHIFNPVGSDAPLEWDDSDDTYKNVNDAGDDSTLWLEADFVATTPGGTTLTTIITSFANGAGSTSGGFLSITGGSAESIFAKNIGTTAVGNSYDLNFGGEIFFAPNATYLGSFQEDGRWQTGSSDAIRGGIIPEPATLSLLGMGIAGLVARRRRKK